MNKPHKIAKKSLFRLFFWRIEFRHAGKSYVIKVYMSCVVVGITISTLEIVIIEAFGAGSFAMITWTNSLSHGIILFYAMITHYSFKISCYETISKSLDINICENIHAIPPYMRYFRSFPHIRIAFPRNLRQLIC